VAKSHFPSTFTIDCERDYWLVSKCAGQHTQTGTEGLLLIAPSHLVVDKRASKRGQMELRIQCHGWQGTYLCRGELKRLLKVAQAHIAQTRCMLGCAGWWAANKACSRVDACCEGAGHTQSCWRMTSLDDKRLLAWADAGGG
jgi:hypothetical protein